MNAKHLTKNAMSHKLVFLAVSIAIAIVAAFSICVTIQANGEEPIRNDSILDSKFYSSIEHTDVYYEDMGDPIKRKINNGETIEAIYKSLYGPTIPSFDNVRVCTGYNEKYGRQFIYIEFYSGKDWIFDIGAQAYVEPSEKVNWKYSDGSDVVDETVLNVNQTYNFIYGDVSFGTNISGNVWDAQTNMPVPFANVVYCQYNPWWDMYLPVEGVEPAQTDMWGFYTLEGITDEMRPGKVMAFRWGYVFDGGQSDPIGWWLPEDIETIWRTVQLTPVHNIDLADVEINGGPHHVNFVTTYELVKDGKVVESDGGTFDTIKYKVPVGSSYAVYDDGTLHCSYSFGENGASSIVCTVKAVAEEGYTLDKWNINGVDLIPGQDYILHDEDVMGLASYKLAEQPVPPVPPTPGPTPVNPGGGIAQTGDATPFAAVAVLAVVAALGCGVVLRKETWRS